MLGAVLLHGAKKMALVQLGDADVKKIEECTAIYLVRNPQWKIASKFKL